ncbi:hypothetical protein TBLA_0D02200 [Henningerozyma blattae CBS 6284]|uniref:Mnd1 HTH domain-containing protein n=1 Tax=Henningerozyma blattae (strain ATCC 34711 / CBS 6284 / DSM 70876 / NBRC 10599 / NRRL Y-10934 / UCD 77-7) TaxID=1071380 RepID=I2H2X3_HENB6|nr:hypothetical protein TBLA_0D02200 [Tetrapisispora blattae CBS 6284]CCH60725.1 hypothetical protein TBLA_0D02200 [Tetrapisispora blattae CBS 6284]
MPPKTKGLSLQEKKLRILNFMQEEFNIYSMKDLEKLVPKRCPGISSMVVKDLIQQLLDEDSDGVIFMEKCGAVNVYWSFKNQSNNKMLKSFNHYQDLIADRKLKIKKLQETFEFESTHSRKEIFSINEVKNEININNTNTKDKAGTIENNATTPILENMVNIPSNIADNKVLTSTESDFSRSDKIKEFQNLQTLKKESTTAIEKIKSTKWTSESMSNKKAQLKKDWETLQIVTDNIELLIDFLSKKYAIHSDLIRKELGIPEEFRSFVIK